MLARKRATAVDKFDPTRSNYGDNSLRRPSPGLRGIVSIGVLVLALFLGGNSLTTPSSLSSLLAPSGAAAEEPAAAAPASTDLMSRLLAERWVIAPAGPMVDGSATHYGAQFNGSPMGCGGVYQSENMTIVAVDPTHYADWECGAFLFICGPSGCIVGVRQDSCPGCAPGLVDLSEYGYLATCGNVYPCAVSGEPTAWSAYSAEPVLSPQRAPGC